ncbi:hypothetical protein ETAA8_13230 [Anatilimnocola aggregata]|uniref:DUF2254 domain-containing protein n=1 Tax=Anatilimnocola aggregata TaxID=2528021 RepID=A0A517Y7P5_9BACT|nr:DUF2254 domain-containing protein [Anatilimnocola aggregata]QDU26247.1 hypothetical protein ETAA8_13230 [Anatilimnocola aggregata]
MNDSSIRYHWESLRTSYWFIPAILGIAAIGLSIITVAIDHTIREHGAWKDWTYTGGPEGARAVLATIAGSMITVAGVVFSITIVALSLASAQFGPRLLRNFIRDRRNQFVLGTFTATFLYCLLILRTVRGSDHDEFVPGVSVTIGMLLAIFNLGVLIYFIHHVAISIQATSVIRSVSDELNETIDRLWPANLGSEPPDVCELATLPYPQDEALPVLAEDSGYVDAIQDSMLIKLAKENSLIIRLAHRPGHFAVAGTPLAWAWPPERATEDITKKLNKAFVLASHRTPFQDVEFAIDQLVEIAIRALSPGINDPFTALNCIDRLGEALCRLARRSAPSSLRFDDEKELRVITYPARFAAVTDAAFNQIRQYGASSAAVMICLMETIGTIASQCRREDDFVALARHAELVARAARRSLAEEADLADLEERHKGVLQEFARHVGGLPIGQVQPATE